MKTKLITIVGSLLSPETTDPDILGCIFGDEHIQATSPQDIQRYTNGLLAQGRVDYKAIRSTDI